MKNSFDKRFCFAAIFLAVLILISFGYSMSGYFLADDTWQVQFAHRVINGESHLLFDNFGKSYLGIPALDFYRPLLGFTYVSDYLLFHMNAWGYYLTNLILAWISAICFFLSVRALTRDFGSSRSYYCALSAAVLFASSPLHCEDICWISGRADLLAAAFFLPSLYWAILSWQAEKRVGKYYLFSLLAYACSLMSKESAVGLPLIVASLPLVCSSEANLATKKERLLHWLKFSLPYFLMLLPYFSVRALALGNPIGGYTGDMGLALSRWMYFRWFDPATIWRLIFPLPEAIFPDPHIYILIVECLYAAIAGLLIVRLVTQRLNWRGLLFIAIMLVQAFVPLSYLWGLDQDLHNQRIYYFFTMPLALLLPWLVFAPKLADREVAKRTSMVLPQGLEAFLDLAFGVLLSAIALLFAFVSFAITSSWVQAGGEVKDLMARSSELVAANQKPVIVLGIPHDTSIAHIILCGFCFKELFEPPFSAKTISDRLLTFHCCVAGHDEIINSTRFKQALGLAAGPFIWSSTERRYNKVDYNKIDDVKDIEVELSRRPQVQRFAPLKEHKAELMVDKDNNKALAMEDVGSGASVIAEGLDLNPLSADYLTFDLALQPSYRLYSVSVQFDNKPPGASFVGEPQVIQGISALPPKKIPDASDRDPDGRLKLRWQHIDLHLSHFWRWYAQPKISRIKLTFNHADRLAVKNLHLISDRNYLPSLSLTGIDRRSSGDYVVGTKPLQLIFDCTNLSSARRMQFVISKVNESFDNFIPSDLQAGRTFEAVRLEVSQARGYIEFPARYYQGTGYYEIKARALDDQGKTVGDWSDAITIYRPSDKGPAAYYAGN